MSQRPTADTSSRRDFLKTGAAVAAGAQLVLTSPVARSAHAAGSDVIRVGLVGCGGRGTGAAVQALKADPQTRLVAMSDAFEDQLDKSYQRVQAATGDQFNVGENKFVGFDGYKAVIEASDVVLLCTPPKFRPEHLAACVAAGKHVFAEKPVAVDAPGIRSVLESCQKAREQNTMVVSGLCWRYETGMQQTMDRLHDGAIGDIRAVEATRYASGVWVRPRQSGQTDMQYQMRNWYYFTWLSGDFIVEQFVHQLDQVAWLLKDEYPTRCYSSGGRIARTGKEYGHAYDHFNTVFEYESGVRLYAGTRHQPKCNNFSICYAMGAKGNSDLMKYDITGENAWRWDGKRTVMHQLEHDAMYAALRRGETINNGDYMAKSTMMAIMARESAYTGKFITWEQAMNSTASLGPQTYDWDTPLAEPPVAIPGVTQFS